MKASELIGRPVIDHSGNRLGYVTDLRCIQDGPLRGAMCAPRVHFLVVSPRHLGSLLGYNRRSQQGPWLIRVIIRRLHRRLQVIPWQAVASYDETIVLNRTQL
jgi:uncharacterized protein YrrD